MKINENDNSSPLFNDLSSLQSIKGNPDSEAALREAAEQFEAVFLQTVLKHMRQASEALQDDDEDNPFNSRQQQFYRSMHDSQLAVEMSRQQSVGIADMLVNQLGKHEAFKPQPQTVAVNNLRPADGTAASASMAFSPVSEPTFSPVSQDNRWRSSPSPLVQHVNNLGDPTEL